MKRSVCVLLAALLVVCLVSCGSGKTVPVIEDITDVAVVGVDWEENERSYDTDVLLEYLAGCTMTLVDRLPANAGVSTGVFDIHISITDTEREWRNIFLGESSNRVIIPGKWSTSVYEINNAEQVAEEVKAILEASVQGE